MKNFTWKPRRSLLALAILSATGSVLADEKTHHLSIAPQNISDALKVLANETHIQIFSDGEALKGKKTSGIQGDFTAKQAIQKLLAGTGLTYTFTADDAVAVKAAELGNDTTLTAVKVTGKASSSFDGEDPYNTAYNRANSITATKTDTPLMQTPLSVKVVPQQVLKDQQVITVDQALSNVSGVTSGLGGTGTFFMRGFGNYNVYRDGFLNQSQWSHTEDLANIERVEVLKGPGSILYGRTEPGGLVNFVTKQPLDTPYYSLRQQFGSFDLYRTTIDATGPLTSNKDLAYRFNLGYQSNNSFQQFGGNERLLVAPSVRWNISDKTTSTLKLEYSDIKETGNGTVPLMGNRPAPVSRGLNLGDPWNLQEDEYVMLSVNTEHAFNDNWKLRHRFNFSNHTLTMSAITPDGNWSPVQSNGDQTRSFWGQNIDGKDYQHNFFNALELTGKFNTVGLKHTMLVGGDYYRTDYRASMSGFGDGPNQLDTSNIYTPAHMAGAPYIPTDAITYNNITLPWFGLYAQDQIELPWHIHLMGGLRYDNASFSGTSTGLWGGPFSSFEEDRISPRGGIVWQALPELSFYGSYTENFGATNSIGRTAPLPPQTAQQWETGIKTELWDGRLTASVAYFDLKKQNIPMNVDPLTVKAIGAAESRGIEFDFSGEILPGWNVIGGYAWTPFAQTTKDSFTGADAGNTGLRLNNAPRHNGNLWSTYEIQSGDLQGVKFGAGMRALTQREIGYNESAQAPGYVTMNLMGSKAWKIGKSKITTQLNIDNLLDKTYTASIYSYGPTYYGAPRTFMGSIKVEY